MRISKKRILSVLAATALSIGAVPQSTITLKPVLTACAEADAAENFNYSVSNDGTYVTITKCISSDSDIVVPDTIEGLPVTAIGSQAFMKNETIVRVVLPDTITEIGFMAFSQCANLQTINMPLALKTIGGTAFGGCTALEEIDLPSGVETIENGAFSSCTNLGTVQIPETVTSIGESAFRDTAWLTAKRNENPLVIVNSILIDGTTCSGDVVFPDNVTVAYINNMAFYNNTAMTGITIPDTVAFIGNQAFMRCSALKSVTIPDNVTEIGSSLFDNCSKLEYVELSDSLTTLNSGLFNGCSSLTSVKLPASLTKIPAGLFQSCENLKDITLPETVETIDMRAFLNCTSLDELVIPDGVQSIGMQAFAMCMNLKSITIPDSVTSIGSMAFTRYPELTIKGNVGSYASTYAQNNGIGFDAFNSVSLTLSDDLGLNFYVGGVDTDEIAADYRVTFSGKCEENGEAVSLKKKNGGYCATANVSADHMDEEITAVLECKDGEEWKKISEHTYSVNKYLDSVDTSDNEALAKLVDATKEYGQVTDAYFNGGTVTAITDEQVNEVIANTYDSTFTTDEAKLSLVLDSKLAARIYIKDKAVEAGASAEYTQYISDTSPWYDITAKAGGKAGVYFEIPGLAPTELHVPYRVKYDGKYYNFSPLTWARRVMKNPDSTDKSKAMAYALYKYYVTARDFKYADEA